MDFNLTVDRTDSNCVKYNAGTLRKLFGSEKVLPFWIADTDFPSPSEVIDAMKERAYFGNFGYEIYPSSSKTSLISWFEKRHNFSYRKNEIIFSKGVMTSVALAIETLTKKGDGVIIQPPVYMAFKRTIDGLNRKVVDNPLLLSDGYYQMNFDDLEKKASESNNKVLLICNPHNPIGRVWDENELKKVSEICVKHDLILISDEIHADLTFPGNNFKSIISIDGNRKQKVISTYSPVKTFNLMSISDGFIFTGNPELRRTLIHSIERLHLGNANAMSTAANEAAFLSGDKYVDEIRAYILENYIKALDVVEDSNLPLSINKSEGTYLIWLDFRQFNLSQEKLIEVMTKDAEIGLIPGDWFGTEGEGFFRMNIGCPKDIMVEGLERIITAFSKVI